MLKPWNILSKSYYNFFLIFFSKLTFYLQNIVMNKKLILLNEKIATTDWNYMLRKFVNILRSSNGKIVH